MKAIVSLCMAVVFLAAATPLLSQGADLDDEDIIMLAADVGSAPAPAPGNVPGPRAGGPPGMQHPGYDHWGSYGHGPWGGMIGYLNLSQDQVAKMRDIWKRYYLDTRNLRYDLMQKRIEMRKLFTDPKVDAGTLMAKQKELASIRARLMDRRAQAMIECRSLLTPEQLQRLDILMMSHRMGAMGPGMGHGMMSPGMMGRGMGPSGW